MRKVTVILAALAMVGPAGAADEIAYFASGWPIALAEAACGGDEGCLTELANCPPGTDGTCTAQVADCTETRDGKVTLESLCTIRATEGGSELRLPDGDSAEIAEARTEAVQALREGGTACLPFDDHKLCFTPITDRSVFEDWAKGRAGDK